MIKIIRKGTKKTIECYECGCYFSFDKEDIEIQEDNIYGYKYIIRCPQCETVIALEATR